MSLFLFSSCTVKENPIGSDSKGNRTNDLEDPQEVLNIQTETFTEIDSSGVLIYPLMTKESQYEGRKASYKEMPYNEYWNLIFYDSKTKDIHLLTNQKMIILDYNYKGNYEDEKEFFFSTKYIFYTIRVDDFNKDKLLTEQDPKYLFISDKFGNNLKQISPKNYNLNSWRYVKSSNKVIMTVEMDSDGNSVFDRTDEITSFEIDLERDSLASEIFKNEFKSKIKILFDRDWKRIKR